MLQKPAILRKVWTYEKQIGISVVVHIHNRCLFPTSEFLCFLAPRKDEIMSLGHKPFLQSHGCLWGAPWMAPELERVVRQKKKSRKGLGKGKKCPAIIRLNIWTHKAQHWISVYHFRIITASAESTCCFGMQWFFFFALWSFFLVQVIFLFYCSLMNFKGGNTSLRAGIMGMCLTNWVMLPSPISLLYFCCKGEELSAALFLVIFLPWYEWSTWLLRGSFIFLFAKKLSAPDKKHWL